VTDRAELYRPSVGASTTESGTVPQWYALHTRSKFESRVVGELATKGLDVFLPTFDELHHWKDRIKRIAVPIFPGYAFVRFPNLPARRLQVLQTHGVVRILGSGGEIEPVDHAEIESLQRLLSSKLPCFVHPYLQQGDWVRVKRGALRGLKGILVRAKNQTRVVVTIDLISQAVATEIDVGNVEPLWHQKTH
jgi:transcription antitermination factor NusG